MQKSSHLLILLLVRSFRSLVHPLLHGGAYWSLFQNFPRAFAAHLRGFQGIGMHSAPLPHNGSTEHCRSYYHGHLAHHCGLEHDLSPLGPGLCWCVLLQPLSGRRSLSQRSVLRLFLPCLWEGDSIIPCHAHKESWVVLPFQ